MLKTITQLEFILAEKAYNFTCAPDSPIEHIKEALFQFQAFVANVELQIKAAKEAAEKINPAPVEPSIETVSPNPESTAVISQEEQPSGNQQ